jgi:hypothetical protein
VASACNSPALIPDPDHTPSQCRWRAARSLRANRKQPCERVRCESAFRSKKTSCDGRNVDSARRLPDPSLQGGESAMSIQDRLVIAGLCVGANQKRPVLMMWRLLDRSARWS